MFTAGAKTTAAWSVVNFSDLWANLDLAGEHYHPRKLFFLDHLNGQSEKKIKDLFTSIREIFDPNIEPMPASTRVYDVADALGNFLKDGRSIANPEDIGSTKKIARPGDVIVSRLRSYLREIAIVPELDHVPLISTEFIVLRRKGNGKSHFLLPYLLSEPVQTILRWSQNGSNHPRFAEDVLLDLPLPAQVLQYERDITRIVEDAMLCFRKSKILYVQAESLLMAELGLDDLDLSHQTTYTRNFSQVWAAGRLDAEYFQPKYQRAMGVMRRSGKLIGDVARLAKRRFEAQPGKPFHYIEIGDLDQAGHAESKLVPGEDAPSRAQWIVKSGDVIISTVRPVRRLSALIEPEQNDFVCSSGFAVLKPTAIEPEVLLVYLRLPIVCEILDLHTTASMYPAMSTTSLLNVPIPIPPDRIRSEIVNLIQESRKNRREAKRLLKEARQRVEAMILGESA